ncbi:MAG: hypothetical protein HY804_05320, partial [Nitrospinae bacterium]|nr:hypothetical protein [Nitrospinota bacterium]
EEEEAALEIAIAEEPAPLSAQDDIDALLAAHAPKDKTAPATKQAPSPQDDIDALMAAHAPKQEEEEALDDIDALLAGVAGGEAPPAPRVEEEEEPAPEPSPAAGFARPQEETDIISQDDIDALLKSSGDEVAVDETAGEEEEVEIPIIEETGDELDKLLGSKDDSVGEDLFGEGETVSVSPGAAPSLDDMLATETVAVEPGDSAEETIDTDAVLGIPSAPAGRRAPPAEEALFEPIEEVEEPPARAGVMDKVMALFGTLMGVAAGVLAKFRLPGLSPRFGKAVAAVAVVAVVALAGGGYWFFFGHKAGAPAGETAGKEGEAKPAGQEEAAAPLGESLLASTGTASHQEPAMSFTIYLPVEFDAEISRVMKLDMTMIFENFEIRDDAMQRSFYLTVQVENTVDAFFEDKFYTDTVFAQDKLEEFLNEKLKAMAPMAGLRQSRVDGISFEEEAAPKPESAPTAEAAAPKQ